MSIRKSPCADCPYRRDSVSGVWAPQEYDKLPLYDAPTMEQPPNAFGCHATPEHFCHGWAVVHSSRGHEYSLLALRMARLARGDGEIPPPAVPLFASGAEACAHGKRDVAKPPARAKKRIERLLHNHPRLKERNFLK